MSSNVMLGTLWTQQSNKDKIFKYDLHCHIYCVKIKMDFNTSQDKLTLKILNLLVQVCGE